MKGFGELRLDRRLMRNAGFALEKRNRFFRRLVAAVATCAAASTLFYILAILAFRKHGTIDHVKSCRNYGRLGVRDEAAHHAGREAATKTAGAATASTGLKRRIQNGANVGSRGRSAHNGCKHTCNRRFHIRIKHLLGCLVATPAAASHTALIWHFC